MEYAYAVNIQISPNVKVASEYKHRVRIVYELKDASKVKIDDAVKEHLIESTGADSMATVITKVNDNLATFIASDKEDLAGYVA